MSTIAATDCQAKLRSTSDGSTSYITTKEYDGAVNVTSLTPPGSSPIEYEYDGLERVVGETHYGSATKYSYDLNDNLIRTVSPRGYRTVSTYNALNQLTSQTDPEGGVTEYLYDESGRMTWFKDAIGNIRTTRYDELGRPIEEIDGRGMTTAYAYDAAGNLTGKEDAAGTEFIYEYNETNLLTAIYKAGNPDELLQSFTYDEAGVRTGSTDGSVIEKYNLEDGTYVPDPYGLVHKTTRTGAGSSETSYEYDKSNRLTGITYPSGREVTYTYDSLGRTTGVPGIIDEEIAYADNTYLSGYTLANGVSLARESTTTS